VTRFEYVSRIARKPHQCSGDGAKHPGHAEGCTGSINPGDLYIENLDEAPAYQAGTRHTMACAERFFGVDVDLERAARAPRCTRCGGPVDAASRCEDCGRLT
jgi:hypothetical protein